MQERETRLPYYTKRRISALRYNEKDGYWEYRVRTDCEREDPDIDEPHWFPEYSLKLDVGLIEDENMEELKESRMFKELTDDSA